MRFRITVRGDGIELRGYLDGDGDALGFFAEFMRPYGLVIASPAADDYNPFGISEPDNPPTPENSMETIGGMWEQMDPNEFRDVMAQMHYAQASVIRGERYLREQAEAELRDRELHHVEVEQENAALKADHTDSEKNLIDTVNRQADVIEQIKAIRSNFPEKCEVHDEDEITCGWKSMIAGIDKVLANG